MTRSEHLKEQGGYPVGDRTSNALSNQPSPPLLPSLYNSPHIDYGKPDNPLSKAGQKRRKHPVFYHEKTPVAFNACLLDDPYFAANWKIIPTVYKALNVVLCFNQRDQKRKGGKSDIRWRFFFDRFDSDYPRIIDALERLQLLQVLRAGRGRKGLPCYAYHLTDKCHRLLSDANREYLHKLLTDRAVHRRLQKRISSRGYNKKVYGDVRDRIKATIDGVSYKEEDIDHLCECFPVETAAYTRRLLIEIKERRYGDLEHNDSDNRISNPYSRLPEEVKARIQVNGLRHVATLDIRSAYPSMWAMWIHSLHPDNVDVKQEREAYEKVFLNPALDPKVHLSDSLHVPVSSMKAVMIQYFNGKGFRGNRFIRRTANDAFVKFNGWLRSEFPAMYSLWLQTNIKQTGNNIGKHFETKLMLDQSIFEKAEELGFALGYEYDGYSVFGGNHDDGASLAQLVQFMSEQALRLLGSRLVFVNKAALEWNPVHIRKATHEKRLATLYENWVRYTKAFFRNPRQPKDRDDYAQREAEWLLEGRKCVEKIEQADRELSGMMFTPPDAGGNNLPKAV